MKELLNERSLSYSLQKSGAIIRQMPENTDAYHTFLEDIRELGETNIVNIFSFCNIENYFKQFNKKNWLISKAWFPWILVTKNWVKKSRKLVDQKICNITRPIIYNSSFFFYYYLHLWMDRLLGEISFGVFEEKIKHWTTSKSLQWQF